MIFLMLEVLEGGKGMTNNFLLLSIQFAFSILFCGCSKPDCDGCAQADLMTVV